MANIGIAPVDPTSLVGQTRAQIGDVVFVALDPAVAGYGDFAYFSDAEISSFLLAGLQSVLRASGHATLALARNFALTEANISTDDLSSNDTTRSSSLLKIAQLLFDQADADDAAVAASDFFFDVVDPWCPEPLVETVVVTPPVYALGLVPFGPS